MREVLLIDEDEGPSHVATLLDGTQWRVGRATYERAVEVASSSFFHVAGLYVGPERRGLERLEDLRMADNALPVVVLAEEQGDAIAVRALRRGATDCLAMPLTKEALLASLELASRPRILPGEQLEASEGIGRSAAWLRVLERVSKVARAPRTPVLLQGARGSGKEVAARLVHRLGARHDGPFVAVNVATLGDNLAESELFGHEQGAFTGAHAPRRGFFELARGGTLLLDEIGELALPLQAKLLRVLETRTFRRVGGERELPTDAKLVFSTNRDLEKGCSDGWFRPDLFDRISTFRVDLPSLDERREDIPLLARHFLRQLAPDVGGTAREISPDAMELLTLARWNGNVRQLRNVIEEALISCEGHLIEPRHLSTWLLASNLDLRDEVTPALVCQARCESPADSEAPPARNSEPLETLMLRRLQEAFEANRGNINRTAAALGVSRATVRRKLRSLGVLTAE